MNQQHQIESREELAKESSRKSFVYVQSFDQRSSISLFSVHFFFISGEAQLTMFFIRRDDLSSHHFSIEQFSTRKWILPVE